MRGFIQKHRGFAVLAAATITFIPLAPARSAPFDGKPPAAFVERVSRQLVVAIAAPRPTDRAETVSSRAARVAERLSALGLTRVRALDGAIPTTLRGGALEARATGTSALNNPFGLDPSRVFLAEASDPGGARMAQASLETDGDIDWVEPNQIRVALGAAPVIPGFPNDPQFQDGHQYALFNIGSGGPYHGTPRADIHAPEGWAFTRGGNDIILAIADTGIDPNHPDLAGLMPDGSPRLLAPINITGVDPESAYADSFGHGTGVVGAMAARTNNGASVDTFGVAGVCGGDGALNAGCRIVAVKITPGNTGFATSFDIGQALLYATSLGARAMNLSFAGTSPSRVERLAMYEAITHGCVMVVAAGNSGFNQGTVAQYPSAYSVDGLGIQVGASDENDQRAVFSSYGPGLDLLAPGVNVYSTFMTYPSAAGQSWPGFVAVSGTSIAAPHVAGAVGLLASVRPELIENDFQRVLRESADDIGDPGVDALTGWGRLDLGRALDAVNPSFGIWHDEALGTLGSVVATDSLVIDESGPGVMDHARLWPNADEIEVLATIALPDSFLPPYRVWPRVGGTFTVAPGFHLRYFAPWAEVLSQDATSFTLRGYIYQRRDACTDCDEYLPLPPDQARFGFTVLGRVDRPATVTILAPAPNSTFGSGDSVCVAFEAEDPDVITSIEIWLDAERSGSILVATLPGGTRAACVRLPCTGHLDQSARLRIVAVDQHGPHFDRGEASIPVQIRGGICGSEARALAIAPNPTRGAARIEGTAGAEVVVLDVAGRLVRRVRLDPSSGNGLWDGLDQHGRRVMPGIYLVRMPRNGRLEERKLVRLE
ncbi:MAG TPA: S8 family serine peptidase [Candidatus Udaeobacter sp.]|jgi:subtilisin family serine protease|nr:S8 family serine peptidase [Candidatus Udaeobacter sp.]